jgi:hypothetical protein
MKKLLLTLMIGSLVLVMWGAVLPMNRSQSQIALTDNRDEGITVHYAVSDLNLTGVSTARGQYTLLTAEGLSFTREIGSPQLPVSRKIIAVPVGADVVPQLIGGHVAEFRLADYGVSSPIIPAQPSLSKSQRPQDVPFVMNDAAYRTSGFDRSNPIEVEELGIMRGLRLFLLTVHPVEYDPTAGIVRIRTDFDVQVQFNGANLAATNDLRERTFSPFFEGTYSRSVFNYRPVQTRDVITEYPVKYVIISAPTFQATLQPFVEWKKQMGFQVIEGYTDDPQVGTSTTSIKNFIQGLYDAGTPGDPAPSFVLFVGDVAQIPAYNGSEGSHITDLNYVKLTGNDFLPEICYGRFSANSVAELQPQVDKTLMYEKYTMADPTYLQEVVMIAGVDSSHSTTWANGQINYGTTYYYNEAHGITSHTYLYPASGSSAAQIRTDVSNGVGFANYTAHGSEDGWYEPEFNVAQVNALQNAEKYPLMVGNCCSTSTFQVTTCFGEALLRAVDKGAIGYIGGTNSTYWDEDFYWGVGAGSIVTNPTYETHGEGAYDGVFHDQANEADHDTWFVSSAAMIYCGNLAVVEGGGDDQYYWEIYCLMGDPSLTPYMGQPVENTTDFDSQLLLGLTTFQIAADPYSLVALSYNGVLHGTGVTDASGMLTLEVAPFDEPCTATLVITAQNRVPIITPIEVLPNNGPYVLAHVTQTTDGNDNIPAYGENITLAMEFENVGVDPANNVTATLSFEDQYVTLTDGTASFASIGAGATVNDNAFSFSIANNVPDLHEVEMVITITNGTDTWTSDYTLTVHAPMIAISDLGVNDLDGGDGDGRLDPGETAIVSVPIANSGSLSTPAMTLSLLCQNPWVTLSATSADLVALAAGPDTAPEFTVSLDSHFPDGYVVNFPIQLVAGPITIDQDYNIPLGLQVEDFESGNFSNYGWAMSGNGAWSIVTGTGYNSTRSAKSATIANNQNTAMSVTMTVDTDATITFARMVSSQEDHDYLRFSIDNEVQDEWSGVQDWEVEAYPVLAGVHTFKWSYAKDGSTAANSDCAWVDDVAFPMPAAVTTAILGSGSESLEFGPVGVNHSASLTLSLTNWGNGDLTGSIAVPAAFTVESSNGVRNAVKKTANRLDISIPAGQTQDFLVTFLPTEVTDYTGVLAITSNDPVNPTLNITLNASGCVGNENQSQAPFVTRFDGAYPNPFNPETSLCYSLARNASVSLTIYNVKGQVVRSLVAANQTAGEHRIRWNGTDNDGRSVGTGVYFGIFTTKADSGERYTSTKKMILLK